MKSKLLIVISFFLFVNLFADKDIRVISSTESSLTFEYSPIYSNISKTLIEGTEYLIVKYDGSSGYSDNLIGKIFTKYRNIAIGVPSEFGNTIQVLSTQHSKISGKLLPITGDKILTTSEIKTAEESYKNNELVRFGSFGYSRELGIQEILVSPVQYDVHSSEITMYNKIVIRINFGKNSDSKIKVKNNIIKKGILNFDVAKIWGHKSESLAKANPYSIMQSGTWYRFLAKEEGIYKITRSQLSSLGIDASTVDPRTIKIYNNGGYALNESVTSYTPYGIDENSIYISGEDDGSFDENDYILFYGRGTDFWEYNSTSNAVERYHHPFSKTNYYWITFGGANGKRMTATPNLSDTPDFVEESTTAYKYLDDDIINIGKSGRDYWGDEFNTSNKTHTYVNALNGRLNSSPILYRYRVANASKYNNVLTVSENGSSIKSQTLTGFGSNSYRWGYAHKNNASFSGTIPDNRSVLKFEVSISSADSKAYLDYYEIQYERDLKILEDEVILYAKRSRATVQYKLYNYSNSSIKVFDVTDYKNVNLISSPNIDGGMIDFTVDEDDGLRSKYIVLTDNNLKSISDIEKIEIPTSIVSGSGAEYIIITDKKFADEAERLAEYRKNDAPQKHSTKVVYVDDILNEFSCGMMDPTAIRNFLKYGYENWSIKPFFVLLFGDGNYDYLDAEKYGENFVPTYQTKESMNILASFPMDDYYSRIVGADLNVDLAIGRLNIQTNDDAKNVVDKIISYELPDNGLWKNIVTLVADDRETSDGLEANLHTPQSEYLADNRIPGFMDLNKIYLAAYPTVITGFGRRKPEVNEAIINSINQGTLILNYIGHGNPNVWAHESVFEKNSSIPSLKNDKLFFLTAATCDFGRYDDPTVQSSTEEMLLLQNKGMIGGFTSSRVVYSQANEALNLEFYSNLLDESLQYMSNTTVGEAYYLTKMVRATDNDKKFHLFCDPAIRLNVPRISAMINKVNNQDLTTDVQIKALSQTSIEGIVTNYDGTPNTSFNGEAIVTVYDSEINKKLPELGTVTSARMTVPGGVIFRGRATINNGEFATNFTVPQDISYENRSGKITAYISDDSNDGIGYTEKVIIGETDSSVVNDGIGPEIEITYDNAETSSATLVNEDFNIVLNLQDNTGLNTTGTGIGHKLKGVVDDNLEQEIDFTSHFVGDLDADGKSGVVNYKLTNFELGDHKIEVTAWDVFNNPSQQISYFTVVNSDDVVLKDVVNYPNPFSNNTTFLFQHNIHEPIDVKIKIYTIAGRLIKVINKYSLLDTFVKIDWDGRDEDGSEIANGTYLYKVIIKSIDGKSNQNVIGKLSIIH